jgi:hypothetical protein
VAVSWKVADAPLQRLELHWIESGSPAVVAPVKPGLSNEIIERTANGELGGETKVVMDAGGLSCTFLLPLGPDIIVAAQSASEPPEKDAVEAKAERGAD